MDKVSYEAFNEYVMDNFAPTKVIEIGGTSVEVRNHLSPAKLIDFVENVAMNCFQDDDEYIPELKDFLIRINIINLYTNIELPEDMDQKYDFLYGSDIIHTIVGNINPNEFNSILTAIDAKISSVDNANIASYKEKIDEVYNIVEGMSSQIENAFSSISDDTIKDMSTVFASMANGELNRETFTRAFLDIKDGDTE